MPILFDRKWSGVRNPNFSSNFCLINFFIQFLLYQNQGVGEGISAEGVGWLEGAG